MLGEGATGAEAVDLGLAYRCVDDPEALMPEALARRAHSSPRARPARSGSRSACSTRRSSPISPSSLELEGALPGARHVVARPRRGHGRVPREARREVRRRVSDRRPDAAATHPARRRVQRVRRRRRSPAAVPALRHHRGARLVDAARAAASTSASTPRPRRSASSREETGLVGRIVELLAVDSMHRPDARRRRTRHRLPQRPHRLPHRDRRAARSARDRRVHRPRRVVHARRARDDAARRRRASLGLRLAYGEPAMTTRIPIKYSTPWSWLLTLLLLPRRLRVHRDRRRHVRVRMAYGVPGQVHARRHQRRSTPHRPVVSIGVHGWHGRWLVNGAHRPIARDHVRRARSRRACSASRVQLRELLVSVDDVAELATRPPNLTHFVSSGNTAQHRRDSVGLFDGKVAIVTGAGTRHRPQSRVAARVGRRGGRGERPRRIERRRRRRRHARAAGRRRDRGQGRSRGRQLRQRLVVDGRRSDGATGRRRVRRPRRAHQQRRHPPRQDELQHGRGRVGPGHRRPPEGPLRHRRASRPSYWRTRSRRRPASRSTRRS